LEHIPIPVSLARNPAKKKSGSGLFWVVVAIMMMAIAAASWAIFSPSAPWDPPPQIKTEANPVPATSESLAAAKSIYDLRCAHCHGDRGDGQGPEGHRLRVQPTDFTDRLAMQKVTDGELFWRIGAGRRPMPSFESRLTEQERWELVNYVRMFSRPAPHSH
jgi:mono/diheme cytochrome c family protein